MAGKVKKNFVYNLAYQILVVILPLITTPYISRVLGTEGVGIFGFTRSILSYFVLFGTLGVALYGRREIAYRQNDKKSRSEVFWQITIIKVITVSIAMFIYYFVCARSGEYSLYYKILAFELLAHMLDVTWYFQGLEQFKTIAIRNIIVKLAFVALIFLLVKTPDDLWLYFVLFVGSLILSNLPFLFMLPKTVGKVKINFVDTTKHIIPILALFLPQVMSEVYTVLDKTMLGFLIEDMNEVGIYEQSQKIEKFSLSIVTALAPVMSARIASLYSEKKKDEIKEKMSKSFHFIWFLSVPIAFGIAGVTANLVPWFLGNEFLGAIPVMQIGVILILAIALSTTIGQQYLIPTGRQKVFTWSVFAGAITNFTLNLILIPNFKAVGAIIASVLAECAVVGVQLYAIKKVIPIREIFRTSGKALISGTLMLVSVVILGNFLPATIAGTLVQIVVGALVYVGAMTVLRDSMMIESWGMVKDTLNKVLHKN